MMKKDKRKSEYFGASKGLRLMLLAMMTAMSLLCLSACITIQVPESNSNSNKDVKTEAPKTNDIQTEEPNTADVQTDGQSSGNVQNEPPAASSSQNKSQSSTEKPKKSQSSSEAPKKAQSSTNASSEPATPSKQSESSGISEEQAINIVLSRVKGATKSDIISFKSEYDDGRLEYEGKIRKDGVVYEFEIDGETGNILEWDIDD